MMVSPHQAPFANDTPANRREQEHLKAAEATEDEARSAARSFLQPLPHPHPPAVSRRGSPYRPRRRPDNPLEPDIAHNSQHSQHTQHLRTRRQSQRDWEQEI